jgi:hypothetical protein
MFTENMSKTFSDDHEGTINNVYLNINTSIKEVYESMMIYKNRFYKTNEWWSKELKDIKSEMLSMKKKFKRYSTNKNVDNESSKRLKELKKLFRTQQRVNMRNKDLEKYKFIENLTRDGNKNNKKFWCQVKKFNNNSKLKKINIKMES